MLQNGFLFMFLSFINVNYGCKSVLRLNFRIENESILSFSKNAVFLFDAFK